MVKFSIIIAVYNSGKYLKECLDSIIDQTFSDFEVICINDGSTDNSQSILEEYRDKYDFIQVISQEHQGVGSARNHGMEIASGEYINFLDSDDKFSPNVLESVNSFISSHNDIDVVSIPTYFFNDKNHDLNFKFNRLSESSVVDLNKKADAVQVSVSSSFIRNDAISDSRLIDDEEDSLKFNTELIHSEDLIFINKILLLKQKIGLVKGCKYYFRRSNPESLTNTAKDNKGFYNYRLSCLKDLINYCNTNYDKVPKFIQTAVVYSLKSFEEASDFPDELNDEEINGFWEILYDILDNIDDGVLKYKNIINDKKSYYRDFLFYIKNKKDFYVEKDGKNRTRLKTGKYTINILENHRIYFDIVELKDGFLNLTADFTSSCSREFLSAEAVKHCNGKKEVFKAKYVEYPHTVRVDTRILGIDWRYDYNFEFKIPIDKKGETRIDFQMVYEENGTKSVMKNSLAFRKFAEISKYSHYYIRNGQIIANIGKSFYIMPYKLSKAFRYELSAVKEIFKSKQHYRLRAISFRLLYLLFYPIMKNKEIYLFMDRRDNTGDNGEHLFRYVTEQNDKVKKYFAVQKDYKGYPKLKKEFGSKILEFGSLKHKFIYMFTDKIVSSQGYKRHLNPFADKNLKLVQGISSPPVYFLQHGVGKYNMQSWLRKYDINFSMILTVSDYDQEAFVKTYNYDESIIQELGFPRFDYLTNENMKREIVIIPTWRKTLKTEDDLLSSEYFTRWNNILKDERLISYANEKGYKIVYKPHPNSLKFLDSFNTENVEVDNYRRFHDILCESALMVTDYSSVNFDFAYLKKPIIYYQYGDDYHFEGDALIEDDVSIFGAKIKDEDEIIDKIIEYIDNDCKMEEEYVERVNKFFKYTDKNNCKRVYDWILKH